MVSDNVKCFLMKEDLHLWFGVELSWVRFVLYYCVALRWIASLVKFDWMWLLLSLRGWTRLNHPLSQWAFHCCQSAEPPLGPSVTVASTSQRTSCASGLCVPCVSSELLISAMTTRGGAKWSVRIIFSWSAVVQQETRGGDKLRCSCIKHVTNQFWAGLLFKLLHCVVCAPTMYFVLTSFVCTSAFVTRLWRSGLRFMHQWLMLYTRCTRVSSRTCCVSPVKQWSLQGNKETQPHLMVELRRAAHSVTSRENVYHPALKLHNIDNTILPAFISRVKKKNTFWSTWFRLEIL